LMSGLLYRFRQFFSAANAAPLTDVENVRVHAALSDAAFELYQTMPDGDQRHALKIFDALVAQGHTERPLLQAALLHDVAKRSVGLGYRTGVVVMNKLSASMLARVANANESDWRHPFYISLHHPKLGAELAANAGITEPALTLIRAHQTNAPQFQDTQLCEWHRALKMLDDVN
jgi:hypothetical protein